MPFWAPDIGIDLGTENVSLYVRGRGVVISEPALVVLDREDRHTVQAVGDEAGFLLGRSPDRLTPIWPIRNGLVADFDIAELMLKYFFRKAIGVSYLGKPRVIVSVPCNLDDVNRKALTEAIRYAGAKHVFLIEKPFASAIGTGLPVYDPVGNLVVDIGAGTTDVAVISLGGLVVSQSVQVGGNKFDEALVEYLRKECSILVGSQTAENIKKDLATALPLEEDRTILVRGINQLNTSAGTVSFSSAQAYAALQGPCSAIVRAIRWVLERTPPELAADIFNSGITITGGGAYLWGIDKRIEARTGVKVRIAEEAKSCVAIGTGEALNNIKALENNPINRRDPYA